MDLYLTLEEIKFYKSDIEQEFEKLVNHRWFSARKDSKQWLFLKHCFKVLMGEDDSDFVCTEKQVVQYKYEVTDRLNRYYLASGNPLPFIFSLVNIKKDGLSNYDDPEYPSCNGYLLRVSYNKETPDSLRLKKLLAEKTITQAVEAEWQVYNQVPKLNFSDLQCFYDMNSPAYKRICEIAKTHAKGGWTLQNPMNPSTKRLVDIKIEKMTVDTARVKTSEYWLLSWWSIKNEKYGHTYRELNRQVYLLSWKDNKWLVIDNIYPLPRISTPRRNIRASEKRN